MADTETTDLSSPVPSPEQVQADRDSTPITAMSDHELYVPARDEWHAAKQATQDGKPIPACPHLDELNRRKAGGITVKKSKTTSKPSTPKVAQTFYRHGKPMPDSQNSLSSIAFQTTKGIGGEDVARISTSDLIALLVKGGIKEPLASSWDFTLPNGAMISARVAGDRKAVPQPAAVEKPKPAPRAAKSSPAKKAAPAKRAAKTTTAKRPAAKKPAPRKTAAAPKPVAKKAATNGNGKRPGKLVTPIPKGSTRAPQKRGGTSTRGLAKLLP